MNHKKRDPSSKGLKGALLESGKELPTSLEVTLTTPEPDPGVLSQSYGGRTYGSRLSSDDVPQECFQAINSISWLSRYAVAEDDENLCHRLGCMLVTTSITEVSRPKPYRHA